MQPPNIVADPPKVRIKAEQRKAAIIALTAKGWTQDRIAKEFGVNRSTVVRDLQGVQAGLTIAETILDQAQARIREIIPVEKRIDEYVNSLEQAKRTNQPSAGLQILARLDAIDGLVTDSERLRTKSVEPPAIVPMFALPPGASISVTVSRERQAIDVTPEVTSEQASSEIASQSDSDTPPVE